MGSLEWITLWEAFGKFAGEARKAGLYESTIQNIEADLLNRNPIPQPKKMRV
jgi:hypothetical protein